MTPANRTGNRLLVVSLDGLSIDQVSLIDSRLSSLKSQRGSACKIDSGPFTAAQPAWAEILTGKPWFEVGCPGYARTTGSLNNLHIVQERDLLFPVTLLDQCQAEAPAIIVNVPLLEPRDSRLWLSDGSMPLQTVLAAPQMEHHAPLRQYTPRPFMSSELALADPRSSTEQVFQTEMRRLQCFRVLCSEANWNFAILRISAFDTLCHLLGTGALEARNLSASSVIDRLWLSLDDLLRAVLDRHPETTICLMSLFSHVSCTARLNINKLLEENGFCKLVAVPDVDLTRGSQRRLAAEMIRGDGGDGTSKKTTVVSRCNGFVTKATRAGSPVMGCIYPNALGMFEDGIIQPASVDSVIREVADVVDSRLRKSFGERASVQVCEDGYQAPCITVRVHGAALHDAWDGPAVDFSSKPLSVHAPEGFFWMPSENASFGTLTPAEVNQRLRMLSGLATPDSAAKAMADGRP
jgi:predicted AlkP superfamily phosphohydrolase/phosphomutase